MNVQRAYSLFDVQSLDADRRIIRGIATTPTPDRMGDTIDPMGAKFNNPMPFLHQHNHSSPIGLVRFEEPTSQGIKFEAELPLIEEEGPLRDRIDTAWGEIKHGLVRAVSIGFRALKYAFRDDDGIDFQEIEVYELSAVTIPANANAVVTAVKSMEMSPDVLRQLKTFDYAARRTGPVQLIKPEPQTKNLNGAVRLIRP